MLRLEMQPQCRAFIVFFSLQTWKQTPIHPSSFPPRRLHFSAVNHFAPSKLCSVSSSPALSPLLPLLRPSLLRFLLLLLVSLFLQPCPAQAAWFQVGVVGPWGCDPLFAKALPSVAAQLAVNRINKDRSLALEKFIGFHTKASGYIGPSNPSYCDAASMLSKGWNKALFSWGCVGVELDDVRSHPTFARSMPRPTWVLLSVLNYFRWAHVGIISSSEDIWVETATKVADSLRSHGLPVRLVSIMENTPHGIRRTLTKLRKMAEIRVVILCMHSVLIGGGAQKQLLETAYDMQLTGGSLVFVPYDTLLYSLPYRNVTYPALKKNSKLLRAYDAVLTVTINSPQVSFYEAYSDAVERGELARTLKPQQVSPLFGTIYSSVLFMAHAVHRVRQAGEWMSGGNLARHTHNLDFQDRHGSRRRINQIRQVKGPNRILLTLADVTFINPSLSNKGSSQSPATYENSNVGDWAWLKRLPNGTFSRINPKTSQVFELMKDMRHENVNPFLGFFHDCGVFAIVTEFCSRGSLEDLVLNDDVKLDWMFKSSLLLDLIKGMKYLHHHGVSHTRLKSRNCVVDGRFVLKVTDYGYNKVLEAQRFPHVETPAEDLLWTAPENLRSGQPELHGTLSGDVYSFAIIMQEVVKILKPPPLFRPVVSPDYAPLECIQLMKQCWNEQPEKRPNFEEIFDRFKNINKGKKTNIIDSMLRMLEQYSSNLEELIRERTEELEIEKQKTEKLLTQMLPPSVAEALKVGGAVEPEHFDSVTLYFSDIVGFTTISANSEPIEVVDLLNDLYTVFDAIIGNHDVETIGDAYMVASGLPVANDNRHAAEIANMALDILSAVGTFKMRHMPDVPVRIRIGLHTGPCVAGVVGLTMPRYCLFGDTVTTASRMESSGLPYRIHVHQSTVRVLRDLNAGYKLELRGRKEVKGKVVEETYWLVGREGFNKPLPVPPEIKTLASQQTSQKDLRRVSQGGGDL
ncbi:hypothetical protein FQN60_006411 [Etheostoma spectabile]|uniref:Guanylate cyclase n=1 Tax=Etheostoma spectabile TaxID=54343 RepID=A0A5J5CQT5_9PERO|nr:hypothetical protein FQN60_006411 [Etheostoma spectabile]